MNVILTVLAILAFVPVFLNRMYFLAPTPLGILYYYPNILNEFVVRRLGWSRVVPDLIFAGAGSALFLAADLDHWFVVFVITFHVLVLDRMNMRRERGMLHSAYAHEDERPRAARTARDSGFTPGLYPNPAPHPEFVLNVEGPFLRRTPHYDLGDLAEGRVLSLALLIGNHSVVDASIPGTVRVEIEGTLDGPAHPLSFPPLRSGIVHRLPLTFTATRAGGSGRIHLVLTYADRERRLTVGYRSVFPASAATPRAAEVTRYPGGCRSAFAWRGDMDHYCRPTFQSIDGLTQTLGLAARYKFPQTMFTSSRLVVDEESARQFYEKLGVERGQEEVDTFVDWFRTNVTLRHALAYPFDVSTPYAMELGNHGHLHFGTDAAASPENGWTFAAQMGAGEYAWVSPGADSFTEQRDNAIECGRQFQKHFGFTPKSWAMPDSTNDAFTPRAMEAAGCEVLSDSDISHKHNVLFQPPPHHPENCGSVELTKRYPGDPETVYQVDMIRYWMHRAHRKSIPVIFMCHQHMRQYLGHGCTRFTEAVLRSALTEFQGDLHVNTVYGIGKYWKEVLSPTHRTLEVEVKEGSVVLTNRGEYPLAQVPVDITYASGAQSTTLVDIDPGATITLRS